MKTSIILPEEIHLVGCGGTGGWLMNALAKMLYKSSVHLWDHDTVEERNLDRQMFQDNQIGMSKSEAMMFNIHRLGVATAHDEWFGPVSVVPDGSLVICCADNHPARAACLSVADSSHSRAVICGNEYTDADAYFYKWQWRGTPNDPRVFAPEILTDESGNPMMAAGCTGLAAVSNPQLAIANMASATFAMRLIWFWYREFMDYPDSTMASWPVLFWASAISQGVIKYGDRTVKT